MHRILAENAQSRERRNQRRHPEYKRPELRRELDGWFNARGLRPETAGEFEDSALLKVFGQAGAGFFTVPSVIADEVARQYQVEPIGATDDISEHFYAISVERRVRHPAVVAICEAARSELFA